MPASWWDNPGESGDDTPVIRHAPDDDNYHIPDWDQLSKMRGSKVGRFAIIPAAKRDGSSRGFDCTVAGPVHVDPDAPDGGVVFDPSQVSKQQIKQAISNSYYPHQAFYAMGTPAPLLGFGRKGRFYSQQEDYEDPRVNNRMPGGTYIAPKATDDGRQYEVPNVVADGQGGWLGGSPIFQAHKEQMVNPAPPLSALGQPPQMASVHPPQQQQAPPPQQQGAPPPPYPQQYAPVQPPPQQPYYPPPQQPYYQAPPPDPNMQAMMQAMAGMQQQIMSLMQNRVPTPPTTGVSRVPMPNGPPPGLATMPAEMRSGHKRGHGRQRQRTQVGQSPYPSEDEFDDETARPIRKQVTRDKQTQRIVEEDEDDDVRPEYDLTKLKSAPSREERRRKKRSANSIVSHERAGKKQTVEEFEEAQERDRPRKGVITGFETLNIPWVTGPIANKTKRVVYFEIPGAGKHLARYHDIIDSEGCVVLIYDTRYEDGTQYLPPDLGEQEIKLHCPYLKKTFVVSSMGFHYPFGVFDHIMLVKHSFEALESDERA
jgi:hypothetical protein